ncbi:hypothetical protein [Brevibacillus halotolerans]|uniref:hypothetical protein n=1 Tax=Brevibacillus halotolerans TaxID=1507437 RepID=UPI0015EF2C63|nr:hypothetical protein [Brevibacillus halotolerans]MBA4535131.1 hypothetical protein [Brevibacillus halotolerans]
MFINDLYPKLLFEKFTKYLQNYSDASFTNKETEITTHRGVVVDGDVFIMFGLYTRKIHIFKRDEELFLIEENDEENLLALGLVFEQIFADWVNEGNPLNLSH